MTGSRALVAIIAVQVVCAVFFLGNILSSILGFAPIGWQISEFIELGAALGLVLGVAAGLVALRRSRSETARMAESLRLASSAFADLLEERFAVWGLTPAERDVALFAIKGLSTGEIAALRETSEGTVKAQTAAIYRKAGVTGRPQLLSLFIEDMMAGGEIQAGQARLSLSSSAPPAA
jgi:DNA-binding CsgD family transcriptional regulator